jgi:hypothetical protein
MLAVTAASLLCCADQAASLRPNAKAATQPHCHDFDVITVVQDPQTAPVGTSMNILVRSTGGRALLKTKTDANGMAKLHLCWTEDAPPQQIEATVDLVPGQFAGTIVSFNHNSSVYRIFSPTVDLSQ